MRSLRSIGHLSTARRRGGGRETTIGTGTTTSPGGGGFGGFRSHRGSCGDLRTVLLGSPVQSWSLPCRLLDGGEEVGYHFPVRDVVESYVGAVDTGYVAIVFSGRNIQEFWGDFPI